MTKTSSLPPSAIRAKRKNQQRGRLVAAKSVAFPHAALPTTARQPAATRLCSVAHCQGVVRHRGETRSVTEVRVGKTDENRRPCVFIVRISISREMTVLIRVVQADYPRIPARGPARSPQGVGRVWGPLR